jgi:hypothetical protein
MGKEVKKGYIKSGNFSVPQDIPFISIFRKF